MEGSPNSESNNAPLESAPGGGSTHSTYVPPARGTMDGATSIITNPKQHERSAVVLALFGRTVGPCLGDFSTTYYRTNGRLYAATSAILFYSNLFGFERRLCLRLSDIESIERYRSTSIKISMVDCEDHIFRKFVNREQVLHLLTDLHAKAMGASTTLVPILSDLVEVQQDSRAARSRSATPDERGESQSFDEQLPPRRRLTSESSRSDDVVLAQAKLVRQRSQSMPSLEALEAVQQAEAHIHTIIESPNSSVKRRRVFRRTFSAMTNGRTTPTRTNTDIPEVSSVSSSTKSVQQFGLSEMNVSSPSLPPDFDMQAAWTKAKIPYPEVALDAITLQCSLEGFMDLFFSNEASFPISKYQKEVIKDRDLSYTKWKKSADTFPPIFNRDISFIHPLNNSLGPSEAKTNRQQRFQRFGTLGVTLQNITNIQGVPGADCFKVEDRWVVEALSDNSVRFSVYFQITFFKRTMIKPLIQKNIKAETKKWFQGYVTFIKRALHQEYDRKDSSPLPVTTSEDDSDDTVEKQKTWFMDVTPTSILVVLVVAALMMQLFYLQRAVVDLQDQLALMRRDTLELTMVLRQSKAFQR